MLQQCEIIIITETTSGLRENSFQLSTAYGMNFELDNQGRAGGLGGFFLEVSHDQGRGSLIASQAPSI